VSARSHGKHHRCGFINVGLLLETYRCGQTIDLTNFDMFIAADLSPSTRYSRIIAG